MRFFSESLVKKKKKKGIVLLSLPSNRCAVPIICWMAQHACAVLILLCPTARDMCPWLEVRRAELGFTVCTAASCLGVFLQCGHDSV